MYINRLRSNIAERLYAPDRNARPSFFRSAGAGNWVKAGLIIAAIPLPS